MLFYRSPPRSQFARFAGIGMLYLVPRKPGHWIRGCAQRGAYRMPDPPILEALMSLIAERKRNPPAERSYVVSLLNGGVPKIGAKIEEEAREVVAAAAESGVEGRTHLVHEVADLVFHTLVLLGYQEIAWAEVEAELARRFGMSGIKEKESRKKPGDS
jgi:phosphoribosyl-ATP pyrophosphohydrolase